MKRRMYPECADFSEPADGEPEEAPDVLLGEASVEEAAFGVAPLFGDALLFGEPSVAEAGRGDAPLALLGDAPEEEADLGEPSVEAASAEPAALGDPAFEEALE